MLNDATPLGSRKGLDVLRWEDPSGARVTFELRDGVIDNFMPSFAGRWRTRLDNIRRLSRDVSGADVVDADGEQLTVLTLELEERALLADRVASADAAIIALGTNVEVFEDAAAFAASDSSSLGDPRQSGDPPELVTAMGWPWPPRFAPESFVSTGIFGAPEVATADARLNGTVAGSELRTNSLTGQSFLLARVGTAGFDVDMCISRSDDSDHLGLGMVVGGYVFMVGSLNKPPRGPSRSWLRSLFLPRRPPLA